MNSPKKINYETRPFKFTERKMLLSTLVRICNFYQGDYQYIGFGGLTFTDFKLFHKELHINEMYSIEGGSFSIERLSFNKPYSFIKIHKELSTNALSKIDLQKKTIIWLDYDGALDIYMFEDLHLLMRQLPIGSVYIMTCNKELKSEDTGTEYTVEQFREKFDTITPFDISAKSFTGEQSHKTIRQMLYSQIDSIVKDRIRNSEEIKFCQLYNVLYKENIGAKMFTFGGVILNSNTTIEDLSLNNFPFISVNEKSYKIDIPNITFKEEIYINHYVGCSDRIEELKSKNIISEKDIEKYLSTYKYLPNFFDIRI